MNLPSQAGSAAGGTNTPELDNYGSRVQQTLNSTWRGDPRGAGLWAKLTFIVLESDR